MRSLLAFMTGVLVCAGSAYAQVYKCPDGAGKTVIQQTPCMNTGKTVAQDLKDKELAKSNPTQHAAQTYQLPNTSAGSSIRQIPYRAVRASDVEFESQISADLGALRRSLKDPDSAKFEDVKAVRFDAFDSVQTLTCGSVNAKNSYGGYTGASRFYVLNGVAYMNPGLTIVRNGATFAFAEPTAHCSVNGYAARATP